MTIPTNLTTREKQLVNKAIDNGYEILEIEKNDVRFKVSYRAYGGYGSSKIIYDFNQDLINTIESVKKLKKSLGFRQ